MGGPAEGYRRRGWWTGEALVDRFARHAAAHPEALAVVDGTGRWSAGRLWDADGLPPTRSAGNVLRPFTALKLSLRLPPTAGAAAVASELAERLGTDPPEGASVSLTDIDHADGWDAPELAPWLAAALRDSSFAAFGQPMQLAGLGGSIPFIAMLGGMFPAAQFVVTGVLGPESNAHGPNEFLHVPYAEKLIGCIADILHAEATRPATN